MFKKYSVKLFLALSLTVSILLMTFPANMAVGQEDIFSEVKAKVAGISEKEKETLQKLFTQAQEIEETEKKAEEAASDIEKAKAQIENLKSIIAGDESTYEKERESLKQVLQCYQRMGPGSYLEIVLESDSLPDLLMRINTLRDLTRNTGKLLNRITEDREKQSREKAKLSEELLSLQDRQQRLAQTLAEEKKLKGDMESYLASLSEERGRYQEYLDNLQKTWSELQPFFSGTAKELSDFIARESLPENAFKISFDFFSIRVSIDEKTVNSLLARDPKLHNIIFSFQPGMVEIEFPDKNLALAGKFVIVDGHSLKFEAEKGSFYGMQLGTSAIAELFKDNKLILDIKSELEGSTLKSVDITKGYINLAL